jgi:hypothetical protein
MQLNWKQRMYRFLRNYHTTTGQNTHGTVIWKKDENKTARELLFIGFALTNFTIKLIDLII